MQKVSVTDGQGECQYLSLSATVRTQIHVL